MSRSIVAQVFAEEWPRLVAVLVRELGDIGLAEDCAQDAFVAASHRWGPGTTPDRPAAWLLTTARRRAIDRIRRDRRFAEKLATLRHALSTPAEPSRPLGDDQLALVFGCCHPSLAPEAQVALTLREVCGLSTGQIARAFLVAEPTMAKRLVRAKKKIRAAGVPFTVPAPAQTADRLVPVLGVIYLVFTEGHTSSDRTSLLRGDLCDEARWLAGLLEQLLPGEPEVLGLSALLCLTDARRATRVDGDGEIVLLEHQDRRLWDAELIERGRTLLTRALRLHRIGPYQLQAAIASVHATASSVEETDWRAIVGLYDALLGLQPSPVVALNRAVAVAEADGPQSGLDLIDALEAAGTLAGYRYLHAARADLLRRLDRRAEAIRAYNRALELGGN
ncbi:MAG: RNA polymerase sigma factor, partial [Acidimicrobiales bacterium]